MTEGFSYFLFKLKCTYVWGQNYAQLNGESNAKELKRNDDGA
jgi:hypothetical protein